MAGEVITSTMIAKYVVLGFWAAVGGITHALTEKRKGNIKTFIDGCVLALISGFCGTMWGLIAIKFYGDDIVVVAFMSGLGGFMSLEGLAIMATYIKNKIINK